MGNLGDLSLNPADIMRRLRELENQMRMLTAGRRLQAATIGEGGLRVVDNGSLTVESGGVLTTYAPDGGYVRLTQGEIHLLRGGHTADHPGMIVAQHASETDPDNTIVGLWIVAPESAIQQRSTILWMHSSINNQTGQAGMDTDGDLYLLSGKATVIEPDETLYVQPGHDFYLNPGGNAITETPGYVSNSAGEWASLTAQGQVVAQSTGGDAFLLGRHAVVEATAGDGSVYIRAGNSGGVHVDTTVNTGATANANIDANGRITRTSSARRYKQDITDLPIDADAVRRLRPRTWRDRHQVELDPTTTERGVGLIAEEVEAAGLPEFVTHNDAGQPEGVQYDRMVTALLAVIHDQDTKIADLDARITVLESATP